MPESYPVNWAEPMDTSFITDAAKMFMAARDKERARRLAADQEKYKREQDALDRQRQAVQDDLAQKRAQAADMWQADRHKLDVQAAKQKEAEFKLEMRTRQQKEALEKGAAFLEGNPQGAAGVAKYAAIPETSDQYAAPPPDAAAQMPSAVAQPAVPGIEPGAPNLAEAQTLSPIQMARDRAAQEKRKQEEAIALYAAKQKAELANSETLAAAQARAASAVTAAAAKDQKAAAGKPLLQGEANKITELRQGLTQLKKLQGDIGETGLMSGFKASVPGGGNIMGAEEKKRQAAVNLAKQLVGKALEGGVLRKEDEAKYKAILPTMWDKPDVAQAKINQLIVTLSDNYEEQLQTLEDVGRDTSKLRARDKETADPAVSGEQWERGPDGKLRRKK